MEGRETFATVVYDKGYWAPIGVNPYIERKTRREVYLPDLNITVSGSADHIVVTPSRLSLDLHIHRDGGTSKPGPTFNAAQADALRKVVQCQMALRLAEEEFIASLDEHTNAALNEDLPPPT